MDLQFRKVEISFTRGTNTDFHVESFDTISVETTVEKSGKHDHSVVDRIEIVHLLPPRNLAKI